MSKVTSNKSIDFPSLDWSISKGEVKDLPKDKKIQDAILSNPHISVSGKKAETAPEEEVNN